MNHKHRHIHVGLHRHVPIHGTGLKRYMRLDRRIEHGRGIRRDEREYEHANIVVHSKGGELLHSLKFHGGKRKNIHFQY